MSLPEMRRIGPDALRSAGLHLAQADEASLMVVWTEAAVGGALEAVAAHAAATASRGAIAVETRPAGGAVVDAGGRGLLELGVRIADFACAEAGARPGAPVVVRSTSGACFVPYLLRRCAAKGYRAVARYVPGPGTNAAPAVWAAAACPRPAAGGAGRLVILRTQPAEPPVAAGAVDGELLRATHPGLDVVLIACDRPPAADGQEALGACEPPHGASHVEENARRLSASPDADARGEARFREAMRTGLDVDAGHWRAFTALAAQIRIPTSERSRAQAG